MRWLALILAMLICIPALAGQLQLPDGRRVALGSGKVIIANQPPSFHFTVTADQRGFHAGFSNVLNGVKAVARGPGSFHVTAGDFDDTPAQNRAIVDAVLGQNFLWYTPVGNHETETPADMTWVRDEYNNGNGLRTPLKNYTLQNGPTGSVETTFSWDYGNAHFVQLNEYWNGNTNAGSDVGLGTDANIVSNMLVWLAADLNANTNPVVIVFGHEGAYLPPGWRHAGDSLDQYPVQRDAFWALLAANGVQAYINGNSHLYYKLYTNGVYDLDAGNAGNDTDSDGYTFFDIIVGASVVQYDIWRDAATNGNWVKSGDSFLLPVYLPPTTNGLIAYWSFHDAGAGTAVDSAGTNNGTVIGAIAANGVKEVANTAYRFNNSSQYIAFNTVMTGQTAYTVSFWVKKNTAGQTDYLWEMLNYDKCWGVQLNGSSEKLQTWRQGRYGGRSSVLIPATNWTHIALTRRNDYGGGNTNDFTLYVNGVFDSGWDGTFPPPSPTFSGVTNVIGKVNPGNDFSGARSTIDEFRIYNRILTSSEVRGIWRYEKP